MRSMNPTSESETRRAHYQKNRGYILGSRAARRLENLEEERAKAAAYRAANPEKIRAQQQRADAKRREKHKAQKRARWANRDVEKSRENARAWRAANPEKTRAAHRRRKALIRGASRSDFTDAEFVILCEIFEYRCAYCHVYTPTGLTRDHIEPLIKGGPDTLWNIVPACPHCNFSKHAGPVPSPVQPLLLAVPTSPNPNKKPTKQRKATNGTRKASL